MREWLNGIVGEAIAPYAEIAIALLIVFLLIALLFRIIKAFTGGRFGGINQNRLGIIEGMALEGKRRLVIVRRDNVEHLLLIGGENDLVIEQGIQRQAAKASATTKAMTTPPPAVQKPPAKPQAAKQPTQAPQAPQNQQANTPAAKPAPVKTQAPAPSPSPTASPTPSPAPAQPTQAKAPAPAQPQTAAPTKAATQTTKPVQSPPKPNDSAKIKEMEQLLDQLAGD